MATIPVNVIIPTNEIEIEILEDGTIRAVTGAFRMADHGSAEAFMRELARGAGGQQTRKHKNGFVGATLHAIAHATGKAH